MLNHRKLLWLQSKCQTVFARSFVNINKPFKAMWANQILLLPGDCRATQCVWSGVLQKTQEKPAVLHAVTTNKGSTQKPSGFCFAFFDSLKSPAANLCWNQSAPLTRLQDPDPKCHPLGGRPSPAVLPAWLHKPESLNTCFWLSSYDLPGCS